MVVSRYVEIPPILLNENPNDCIQFQALARKILDMALPPAGGSAASAPKPAAANRTPAPIDVQKAKKVPAN
jgi:hypothetical protein